MNSLEQGKKIIKDKIPLISKNPGIYKMLSSTGEILYIGKAKNIPNRLKSYVTDSNLPIRTERMLSLTHNLETTTTNNESEALLLEANLIKKHKPRYNILLRDDKSFPYIYIGNKDKWPQLTKLRGKKSKSGCEATAANKRKTGKNCVRSPMALKHLWRTLREGKMLYCHRGPYFFCCFSLFGMSSVQNPYIMWSSSMQHVVPLWHKQARTVSTLLKSAPPERVSL